MVHAEEVSDTHASEATSDHEISDVTTKCDVITPEREQVDLGLRLEPTPSDQQYTNDSDISAPNEQLREAPLKEKMDELEEEYRIVSMKIAEKFETIPLDELQRYAASLPISVRRHYDELRTTQLSAMTKDISSMSQFFGVLNECSNFLSPALMEDAIKMYGDSETKSQMNTYNSKLQDFQITTTLEEFVGIWEGVTPKGYEEIELELTINWREKTLKDVAPSGMVRHVLRI